MNLKNSIKRLWYGETEKSSEPLLVTPDDLPEKLRSINDEIIAVPIRDNVVKKVRIEDDKRMKDDLHIRATSITRFLDETYNPYKYSTFRKLYSYQESAFYLDYEESHRQNPYTNMVIEFMMNELFSNDYHFEGAGANAVEKFFFEDNTRDKIKKVWRETLIKGNGFMDIGLKRNKLVRTRVLDTNTIIIQLDSTTGERRYYQKSELDRKYLIHFFIRDIVGEAYGISLLRANILFLTALLDTGGDVVAALKRIAYAPIVIKLDLEQVADDERTTIMDNFRDHLQEIQSATNNFIIDKRHEMGLLGQGAAGAKLLPTNQLLEPIISVILFNFGIPLGLFLQTGANKAIIDEQRKAMQRFYEDMKTKIKYYVEKKIIPHITNRTAKLIFNKSPVTTFETQEGMKTHLELFKVGLISKEYFNDFWDIVDGGNTFYEEPLRSEPNDNQIKKEDGEENAD